MPQDFIKDERRWKKAKEIVKKQYNIDESAGDRFYELVMGVYKQARGTIYKKGKGIYFNRKKDGKVRKEKLLAGKEIAPEAKKSLNLIFLSAIREIIDLEKGGKGIPLEKKYPGGKWVTIKGKKVYIMADGNVAPEFDFINYKYKQADILGGQEDIDFGEGSFPKVEKLKKFKIDGKKMIESHELMAKKMIGEYFKGNYDDFEKDLDVFWAWGDAFSLDSERVLAKKEIEVKISDMLKENRSVNNFILGDYLSYGNILNIKGDIEDEAYGVTDSKVKNFIESISGAFQESLVFTKAGKYDFFKDKFLNSLDLETRNYFLDFLRRRRVNELIRQWAQTSADNSPESVSIQLAIKEVFNLDDAVIGHINPDAVKEGREILNNEKDVLKAFVRAQYNLTQAWFKKNKIKDVYVYRGVSIDDSTFTKKIKGKKAKDYIRVKNEGGLAEFSDWAKVDLQPLSSFAVEAGTALGFIHGGKYRNQVVLVAKVPVERVFSTSRTGFGCLLEAEVTVLGGKDLDMYTVARPGYIGSQFDSLKGTLENLIYPPK